jgi:hypothetical protein
MGRKRVHATNAARQKAYRNGRRRYAAGKRSGAVLSPAPKAPDGNGDAQESRPVNCHACGQPTKILGPLPVAAYHAGCAPEH